MRAYVEYGIKSFSKNLAYRSEVWLRILGNVVTILIQVSIWRAMLGSRSDTGVSISEMITYTIVTTTISILEMSNVLSVVDDGLRSGNIAMQLLKPMRYPAYLFCEEWGNVMYRLTFTLIPTFLIAWFFFGFHFPAAASLLPFFMAILISIAMSFAFGYLISLLAFWFMTTFSLRWIYWGMRTLFSGAFLPLWFFSGTWETVAHALPFQYLGFVPAAIYLGKMTGGEMYAAIGIGLLWIALLYMLLEVLWKQAVRRLIIQGG